VTEPLVSVIVPVWNGADCLEACLKSIQAQAVEGMEIIVVDDGSTDGTWTLLQRLSAQDERIRPFRQDNAGVSQARNAGLSYCRGRYIRFVDADDLLPPGSMQHLLNAAEESTSDLVLGAYTEVLFSQRTHRDLGQCEDTVDSEEFLRRLERLSNSFYYGVLWNKLFRGDIIRDRNIRFNPRLVWGEDFSFVMDYCAHAERIRYTQTAIYDYQRNPKGAVVRQLRRCFFHPFASIKDRWLIYDSYRTLYRRKGAYGQYRYKLWRYLFRFTLRN